MMNTAILNIEGENPVARNYEGGASYQRSLQERVVQVLTTGTLSGSFYASARELAQEAKEVLVKASQENPAFLARALVYARNVGLMKSVPTLGLAILSGNRQAKEHFLSAFDQVIRTPDDLRAFVVLCKSGVIPGRKGLGGVAREAVRGWMARLSEYHALKYGSAASKDVTLRDVLRLTHPKPADAVMSERFGWLVKGKDGLGANPDTNPQIRALENLKVASTEEETLALIKQGRLPFEVVVPTLKGTSMATWEALLYNAPYMNLLRNLVTFARHEVFTKEANVEYAVSRLTNPEAVERSKVLPFRFFDALKAYEQSEKPDHRICEAIRSALELSFVNMPSLGKYSVAIGSDVSGSMSMTTISDKSSTLCIDICGIFTGALLKKCEGRVIPLPFEGEVRHDHGLSARDAILTSAQKIARYRGGSTAVGAPIQYLYDNNVKVDLFVGITDNIDWACGEGYGVRGSFLELWRSYRRDINPQAVAYLLTITPYKHAVAPAGEVGVRFIYGWNDSVLKYIAADLEGGARQIQEIEQWKLNAGSNGSTSEDVDA